MSGPADNDKRFEHILASLLREDPGPARQNCPHPGLLSAYFEGKLVEPEARDLEVHLSACSSCQAELAALVRLQPEPATEGPAAEPVPPSIAAPREPSRQAEAEVSPAEPAVEALPFKPKRRRTLWTWAAPVALAASAVLAISVTYRFFPLIEQASRRSGASGVAARAPEHTPPLAARRDEYSRAKEAPQTAPAAPTTAANPAAPLTRDQMGGEAISSAPMKAGPQESGVPTALAPSAAASLEPNALRAKPELEDEQRLERHTANRAALPAQASTNPERALAFDKASKAASENAVIVAGTNLNVAWRFRDASIERSDDAGKTWRAQPSGDATGLLAGSAPSPEVCWLAGRGGLVLRTTDGEHWERLPSPTASDLTRVTASNATSATVQTAGGERFSTEDGGRTWSKP